MKFLFPPDPYGLSLNLRLVLDTTLGKPNWGVVDFLSGLSGAWWTNVRAWRVGWLEALRGSRAAPVEQSSDSQSGARAFRRANGFERPAVFNLIPKVMEAANNKLASSSSHRQARIVLGVDGLRFRRRKCRALRRSGASDFDDEILVQCPDSTKIRFGRQNLGKVPGLCEDLVYAVEDPMAEAATANCFW